MKLLWQDSPLSAQEIIDALQARELWHPKTVKTFLNRLIGKKALGFKKVGRGYLYRPLAGEKDCVREASDSFLERVFGGALQPMLAHFAERKKLSAEEIKELKRWLNQHKE